ncbi:MAG: class II aldolase/adducin family protein [Deltaproteobacteria bacterium]|nr:class II aldolase/adducin family protein [Deltaproteobacteria bacterium]
MNLNELREKVAYACRILAREGHQDNILGHVSARVENQEKILIKPSGFGLEEIEARDLIVCDFEGRKLEGEAGVHLEIFIHTEIYKVRPDVNCVIHTHPPFATAFGSLGQTFRPISYEGAIFSSRLPLFESTTALIRTPELGAELAKTLQDGRAVLMRNHGVTVVGSSVEEATLFGVFLEKAVRAQLLASASGEPSWCSDDEAEAKFHLSYTGERLRPMWDYFVRRVKRDARI